jgi:hypothetical protein
MILKRLGAFLFITAFGFATVQPAAGQSDVHEVTVEVNEIEEISVSGNLSFEIGPANELDEWVSADETATLTTTTNVHSGRKITVQAVSINSGETLGNIGLRVAAGASGDIDGKTAEILGFNPSPGGQEDYVVRDLTNSFETVHEESIDLNYEARVNEDYNPENQTEVQVKYTLTGV